MGYQCYDSYYPIPGNGAPGIIVIRYTPATYTTTTATAQCTAAGTTPAGTLTVSCTKSWSCSGQTIVQTNTDCSTTTLATCTSPQFCQDGASSCQDPTPTFNSSGNLTGHLQVIPNLIQQGATTTVYWNVSNVQSCGVTGTNSDGPWSGLSSADMSSKIYHQVTYTLSCAGYGSQNVNESAVVNVVPVFEEQ